MANDCAVGVLLLGSPSLLERVRGAVSSEAGEDFLEVEGRHQVLELGEWRGGLLLVLESAWEPPEGFFQELVEAGGRVVGSASEPGMEDFRLYGSDAEVEDYFSVRLDETVVEDGLACEEEGTPASPALLCEAASFFPREEGGERFPSELSPRQLEEWGFARFYQ